MKAIATIDHTRYLLANLKDAETLAKIFAAAEQVTVPYTYTGDEPLAVKSGGSIDFEIAIKPYLLVTQQAADEKEKEAELARAERAKERAQKTTQLRESA